MGISSLNLVSAFFARYTSLFCINPIEFYAYITILARNLNSLLIRQIHPLSKTFKDKKGNLP